MMKRIINGIELMLVAVLMCLAVVSAENAGESAEFKLAVNDFTSNGDYSLTKEIPNAYINVYIVNLENGAFKVSSYETIKTDNTGWITIPIVQDKLYYFDGFRTLAEAQQGAQNKKAVLWNTPPYKNFGDGNVCQTNHEKINEYLGGTEDYACADSLSTPYVKTGIVVPDVDTVINETVDLEVASLNYDETSLRAKVCNLGNKAVNGFKIKFIANGKENVLTYVPELSATGCTSVYSWGYSYFGLEASKMTLAEVYVDPLNEYNESNEKNNYKKMQKRPELVKETEEESSMLPAYDETKDIAIIPGQREEGGMLPPTVIDIGILPPTTVIDNTLCNEGCKYLNNCIPVGTKIKDRETAQFCNWNGKMLPQLAETESCQNDYECLSNSCANNKCLDLEKKLEEQQNMLERILAWLGKIFG